MKNKFLTSWCISFMTYVWIHANFLIFLLHWKIIWYIFFKLAHRYTVKRCYFGTHGLLCLSFNVAFLPVFGRVTWFMEKLIIECVCFDELKNSEAYFCLHFRNYVGVFELVSKQLYYLVEFVIQCIQCFYFTFTTKILCLDYNTVLFLPKLRFYQRYQTFKG